MDQPPQADLSFEEIEAGQALRTFSRLNGEPVTLTLRLPGWRMRQRLLSQFLQDRELSGFVYFCLAVPEVPLQADFKVVEKLLDVLAPESLAELERLSAQAVMGLPNQKKMWAESLGLLRSMLNSTLGANGSAPNTPPSPPATPAPDPTPSAPGAGNGSDS